MSPGEYMKSKWVDMIVNSVLILLVSASIQWCAFRDADDRDLTSKIDSKADKVELNKTNEKLDLTANQLNDVATIKYVDGKLEDHEKADIARYTGIEEMFKLIIKEQEQTRTDVRNLYLEATKRRN